MAVIKPIPTSRFKASQAKPTEKALEISPPEAHTFFENHLIIFQKTLEGQWQRHRNKS